MLAGGVGLVTILARRALVATLVGSVIGSVIGSGVRGGVVFLAPYRGPAGRYGQAVLLAMLGTVVEGEVAVDVLPGVGQRPDRDLDAAGWALDLVDGHRPGKGDGRRLAVSRKGRDRGVRGEAVGDEVLLVTRATGDLQEVVVDGQRVVQVGRQPDGSQQTGEVCATWLQRNHQVATLLSVGIERRDFLVEEGFARTHDEDHAGVVGDRNPQALGQAELLDLVVEPGEQLLQGVDVVVLVLAPLPVLLAVADGEVRDLLPPGDLGQGLLHLVVEVLELAARFFEVLADLDPLDLVALHESDVAIVSDLEVLGQTGLQGVVDVFDLELFAADAIEVGLDLGLYVASGGEEADHPQGLRQRVHHGLGSATGLGRLEVAEIPTLIVLAGQVVEGKEHRQCEGNSQG